MTAALLAAQALRYRYPRQVTPALEDVSLTLARGKIVGLLGPNGSGKSTLMNLLNGLRVPQAGSVQRAGAASPTIAWVPQDYAFYPQLTCRENLRFFVSMLAVSSAERAARIDRVVAACVRREFLDKQARHCSGGVRRRLNIAIGLLQQPDVLLLTSPRWASTRRPVSSCSTRCELARQGAAIVYATHYMEEAMAVCHEILILDHGMSWPRRLADAAAGRRAVRPLRNLEALFMHHTQRSLRD